MNAKEIAVPMGKMLSGKKESVVSDALYHQLRSMSRAKWKLLSKLAAECETARGKQRLESIREYVDCLLRIKEGTTAQAFDLQFGAEASGEFSRLVGVQILKLRMKFGWSQQDLASKMNTTQSHVSRLEKGLHQPTCRTIQSLADAFGVEPKEIDRLFNSSEG